MEQFIPCRLEDGDGTYEDGTVVFVEDDHIVIGDTAFNEDEARLLHTLVEAFVHPESVAAERVRRGDVTKRVENLLQARMPYVSDEELTPYEVEQAQQTPEETVEDVVAAIAGAWEELKSLLHERSEKRGSGPYIGGGLIDWDRVQRDLGQIPKHRVADEERSRVSQFTDEFGNTVARVHEESITCAVHGCPIHAPSDAAKAIGQLLWREDRGIFERVCVHGVGHPDPDMMNWIERRHGMEYARNEGVHGCDGCCV